MKIVATDAPISEHAAHASEVSIDDVRPEDIAATIVSSRAQGVAHLAREVDRALRVAPGFAALRPSLGLDSRFDHLLPH